MSLIQQCCRAPTYAPFPRPGRPICKDALIWFCPKRFKKHAENVAIRLQCPNRLNEKDAAVFGERSFDVSRKKDLKMHVQSLSHCYAHAPQQTFYEIHSQRLGLRSQVHFTRT